MVGLFDNVDFRLFEFHGYIVAFANLLLEIISLSWYPDTSNIALAKKLPDNPFILIFFGNVKI